MKSKDKVQMKRCHIFLKGKLSMYVCQWFQHETSVSSPTRPGQWPSHCPVWQHTCQYSARQSHVHDLSTVITDLSIILFHHLATYTWQAEHWNSALCADLSMSSCMCSCALCCYRNPRRHEEVLWHFSVAASQVGHTANDGGAMTSAIHCWPPSICCARPHGLELLDGWPPCTAWLWVL